MTGNRRPIRFIVKTSRASLCVTLLKSLMNTGGKSEWHVFICVTCYISYNRYIVVDNVKYTRYVGITVFIASDFIVTLKCARFRVTVCWLFNVHFCFSFWMVDLSHTKQCVRGIQTRRGRRNMVSHLIIDMNS